LLTTTSKAELKSDGMFQAGLMTKVTSRSLGPASGATKEPIVCGVLVPSFTVTLNVASPDEPARERIRTTIPVIRVGTVEPKANGNCERPNSPVEPVSSVVAGPPPIVSASVGFITVITCCSPNPGNVKVVEAVTAWAAAKQHAKSTAIRSAEGPADDPVRTSIVSCQPLI